MADGIGQQGFNFPHRKLVSALRPGEIVIDFFAGGGGASEALRQALGRDPDVAVNHDRLAIGMHSANHPFTQHLPADVWEVDILREVAGRSVGWFHASPDCTHFSQAKGGQPRDKATRSLSWVVRKIAGRLERVGLAPRIISLENVRQILGWGPLIAKRDKATGRVIKIDDTVAARGERVPLREQFLVPDKRRAGRTWGQFVAALRALGYVVEWRQLKACDYGAGTSRERLFLIARRDGVPISWPEPTHGPGREHPYVTAADCIDWSIPCPSIFERKRPLADATCKRIAKGIRRYVLEAVEPFIVPTGEPSHDQAHPTARAEAQGSAEGRHPSLCEYGAGSVRPTGTQRSPRISRTTRGSGARFAAPLVTEHANASRSASWCADEPLRTQCASVKGGHFALATAILAGVGGRAGDTEPRPVNQPGYTVTAKADCAVITAFLEQAHGGGEHGRPARARGADEPVSTISTSGSQQRVVTAHMAKLRGTSSAADVGDPLATISAGGEHHAIVTGHLTAFGQNAKGSDAREPMQTALGGATRFGVIECTLSPEQEAGALRVAAFLMRYHGTGGQHAQLDEPLTTVTTKDRLALVTVTIQGTPYVIVDIGLRMLKPRELYRAQGFPADYIIDRTADGTRLSISASVRMVGNSVSPPPLAAIARANLDLVNAQEALAA